MLRIHDLPVLKPEYTEFFEFKLPSLKHSIFRAGSWNVESRGIIRAILFGEKQEPHDFPPEEDPSSRPLRVLGGITVSPNKPCWTVIEFRRPFKKILTVVANPVGKFVTDEEVDKELSFPGLLLPKIPRISIYCYGCLEDNCRYGWFSFTPQSRCPKCNSTNIRRYEEEDRFEMVMRHRTEWSWRRRLGDWGAFNWIRDRIADFMTWLQYDIFGLDAGFMPVNLIVSYIDRINGAIEEWERRINEIFSNWGNSIAGIINEAFEDLHRIWSVPKHLIHLPLHLKNITNKGFHVLTPVRRMTFSWLAIGED